MVEVDKILECELDSSDSEIDSELLEDLIVMGMGGVLFDIFENFDKVAESSDS